MNNARIKTFGGYVPVYKLEMIDAEQKIWKAHIIPVENMLIPKGVSIDTTKKGIVFFSRNYKPEINELDQIYVEVHIKSADIIGESFWLIPKEKLLFEYEPPSSIHKPATFTSPMGGLN